MNLGPFSAPGYYVGDCRELLSQLPDDSINCVVTSPPYWGLRNYDDQPGQIGLEESFDEWLAAMVSVFAEVRRVLRPDGVMWLNCGDAYNSGTSSERKPSTQRPKHGYWENPIITKRVHRDDLKRKDLIGMAWELAFALRSEGWYLRCDVVWEKPSAMPEAVSDRPTKSHEYLFLMTKSATYWYDADAIKEPVTGGAHSRGDGVNPKADRDAARAFSKRRKTTPDPRQGDARPAFRNKVKQNQSFSSNVSGLVERRNKRTVWRIPTEPSSDNHFAAFPTKLVTPCILSGCPNRRAGGRRPWSQVASFRFEPGVRGDCEAQDGADGFTGRRHVRSVDVVNALAGRIASKRYRFANERDLQDAVEAVLIEARYPYVRESIESKQDRPDFMVLGSIAVEIKIDGSTSELIRQLHRYAQLDSVKRILAVVSRYRLSALPDTINGKEVRAVVVPRGF